MAKIQYTIQGNLFGINTNNNKQFRMQCVVRNKKKIYCGNVSIVLGVDVWYWETKTHKRKQSYWWIHSLLRTYWKLVRTRPVRCYSWGYVAHTISFLFSKIYSYGNIYVLSRSALFWTTSLNIHHVWWWCSS